MRGGQQGAGGHEEGSAQEQVPSPTVALTPHPKVAETLVLSLSAVASPLGKTGLPKGQPGAGRVTGEW